VKGHKLLNIRDPL